MGMEFASGKVEKCIPPHRAKQMAMQFDFRDRVKKCAMCISDDDACLCRRDIAWTSHDASLNASTTAVWKDIWSDQWANAAVQRDEFNRYP